MPLGRPFVLLLFLGGCALPPDPGMPVPVPAPVPAIVEGAPPAPVSAGIAPASPVTSTSADLARERRAAADSAADAAMLDLLALAKAPDGPGVEGVQFDLDVGTWADHDRVRYYLDFFQGPARERMAIWLERLPRYESHVRALLQERGLPGDLVYLALIESGYSNTAVSRSRAVGMWQFMQPTARGYGLRVDSWVDERRDFIKATDAATRYLADLTRRFGSHFLAAAAYNGGPGRVSRGLGRIADAAGDEPLEENGSLLSDAGFFQLSDTRHIHQETKDYVPKLLAATMIAKEPAKYGFAPTGAAEAFPRDSLIVVDATGLDVVARLAGTSLAEIRELNPHYLRLTTPPGRVSVVRLPAGSMPTVMAAYAALPASERIAYGEHKVRSGETLGAIARRYGVSVQVLTDANPSVGSRGRIRAGQLLRVPSPAAASLAGGARGDAGGAARVHVVARGETLGAIATRYRTSVAQLTRWNDLSRAGVIRIGQRLQVSPGDRGSSTTLASTGGSASGRQHLVQRGETLSAISRRYGVTVAALQAANGLGSATSLKAGARIKIP